MIQELKGNEIPRGAVKKKMSLEKAQNNIIEAYRLEQESGEKLMLADETKNKAYVYMQTFNLKHIDADFNNLTLRLQTQNRVTINYDKEALKTKLSDDILREVICKKYAVTDIDLLKNIMKQYGVPAKVLKSCLEVTESVDKKRMDELFEQGHIKVDELQGCYTLNDNTSLKIKEIQKS